MTGERIFEQLDRDKNGELEFQEFVRVEMLNKQNKTLEGYVETIFELYDTDGDGTISRQEIVDFCKRTALGRGVPAAKADEASQRAADMFLQQVDANNDGTLSRTEVLEAIKAKVSTAFLLFLVFFFGLFSYLEFFQSISSHSLFSPI